MHPTDEDLMMNYQKGETQAMEVLFTRYKQPVFHFALRLLANRADAEDVTSEVFLNFYEKKTSFEPRAKFSTWLFTIVRNRSIDKLRKQKNIFSFWLKNADGEEKNLDIPDSTQIPSRQIQEADVSNQIQTALNRLPLAQREAIVLREFNQFSYDEIAQILNCSKDNVKILIFRAREGLRTQLASFIKEQTS